MSAGHVEARSPAIVLGTGEVKGNRGQGRSHSRSHKGCA
jgi:hypothetical protein